MSIRDEILDSQPLVVRSFMKLIVDEADRISAQGLADYDTIKASVANQLARALVNSPSNEHAIVSDLSGLHRDLKDIKLPGDFDKFANPEKIPVLDPSEEDLDQAEEQLEEIMTQDAEDEVVDVPTPEEGSGPEGLANMVLGRLEEIAFKLGRNGYHTAAYEVEKAMRTIGHKISTGDIWDEMGQMEQNPPSRPGPQQRMQQNWERLKQQRQQSQQQPQKQPGVVQPQNQFQQLWQAQQQANPQQSQQQQQPAQQKQQQQPKRQAPQQKQQQPAQQQQPKRQAPQQKQQPAPQQRQQPAQQRRQQPRLNPQELQQSGNNLWRAMMQAKQQGKQVKAPRPYQSRPGAMQHALKSMVMRGQAKTIQEAEQKLRQSWGL